VIRALADPFSLKRGRHTRERLGRDGRGPPEGKGVVKGKNKTITPGPYEEESGLRHGSQSVKGSEKLGRGRVKGAGHTKEWSR